MMTETTETRLQVCQECSDISDTVRLAHDSGEMLCESCANLKGYVGCILCGSLMRGGSSSRVTNISGVCRYCVKFAAA